jgi:hypothetical protein
MSLWWKRKDKDGKTKMFVIPFGPTIVLTACYLIAVLILLVIAGIASLFG